MLWGSSAGPLPGKCLVSMEPDVMLVAAAIPCEAAHPQERSLTGDLLAHVGAVDALMGDRTSARRRFSSGWLVKIVRGIPLKTIQKARRVPRRPVPKRTRFKKPHVSTRRLFDQVFA